MHGDPLATLDSLAEQVVAAGVTSITGDVIIDDRLFHTFTGWPDTEVTPASPIVINDNRIDVTVTASIEGELATVAFGPQTPAFTVRSEVRTVAAGAKSAMTVAPAEPGVFVATGQIAVDSAPLFRTADISEPGRVRPERVRPGAAAGRRRRHRAAGRPEPDRTPAGRGLVPG